MTAAKLTFKKQPRETGLRAVGYSSQSIDVKLNKKTFGTINAPNWQTADNLYGVSIMVMKTAEITDSNSNCDWKRINFRARFADPEQAKIWFQEHIDAQQKMYTFRFEDSE